MSDVADRLESIRERVEAATEGPWLTDGPHRDTGEIRRRGGGMSAVVGQMNVCFRPEKDAEFVAAARSDVPYLLSLVEEVGEAIAEDDIKVGATGDEAELLLALAEYTQQTE